MKMCCRCRQEKPLEEFGPDCRAGDGRKSACRLCVNGHKRIRMQSPEVHARHLAHKRKYRRTERGKAQHRKNSNKYRERYPERIKAGKAVMRAIRNGSLSYPDQRNCAMCSMTACEYHHPDYSRPLDVIPLCKDCHVSTYNVG